MHLYLLITKQLKRNLTIHHDKAKVPICFLFPVPQNIVYPIQFNPIQGKKVREIKEGRMCYARFQIGAVYELKGLTWAQIMTTHAGEIYTIKKVKIKK